MRAYWKNNYGVSMEIRNIGEIKETLEDRLEFTAKVGSGKQLELYIDGKPIMYGDVLSESCRHIDSKVNLAADSSTSPVYPVYEDTDSFREVL